MTELSSQIKILCDRAKDFIKDRQYSAAMELLNEAVALDKFSARPVSTLGIVYLHQKQYDLKYDFKKMQLWTITEVFRETREKKYDYVPIHEVSAYENVSECSIHYYSKKIEKEHLIEVVCSNCQTR